MKDRPKKKVVSRQPIAERVTVKEIIIEKEVPRVVEVEKFIFSGVAFKFDKAELTDLGIGKVYLAARMLKEKPDPQVVIEGHADFRGTEDYNMKLGLRRAEAVKKELTRLGIDPDRISVTSQGESRPLIDMQTDWARAVNRRVEFNVSPR
jgi:peptidoglycan-associated lipoprotein